jgi:hypothetical protein
MLVYSNFCINTLLNKIQFTQPSEFKKSYNTVGESALRFGQNGLSAESSFAGGIVAALFMYTDGHLTFFNVKLTLNR